MGFPSWLAAFINPEARGNLPNIQPAAGSFLAPTPGGAPIREESPEADFTKTLAAVLATISGQRRPRQAIPMPAIAEKPLAVPQFQAGAAPIGLGTSLLGLLGGILSAKENKRRAQMQKAFQQWQLEQGVREKEAAAEEDILGRAVSAAGQIATTKAAAAGKLAAQRAKPTQPAIALTPTAFGRLFPGVDPSEFPTNKAGNIVVPSDLYERTIGPTQITGRPTIQREERMRLLNEESQRLHPGKAFASLDDEQKSTVFENVFPEEINRFDQSLQRWQQLDLRREGLALRSYLGREALTLRRKTGERRGGVRQVTPTALLNSFWKEFGLKFGIQQQTHNLATRIALDELGRAEAEARTRYRTLSDEQKNDILSGAYEMGMNFLRERTPMPGGQIPQLPGMPGPISLSFNLADLGKSPKAKASEGGGGDKGGKTSPRKSWGLNFSLLPKEWRERARQARREYQRTRGKSGLSDEQIYKQLIEEKVKW